MKRLKLLLVFIFSLILFSGCDLFGGGNDLYKDPIKVNMEIQNYGTVKLELYPNVAPITVNHFVSLVKDGFYNGLTFHRIMKNFMIQGGDPTGTGKGGISSKIKGEFLANGIENKLNHDRGVLSMARGDNDYNSASCQFFIMIKTDNSIDGHYASFGRVTSGMDIIDKIVSNTI